MQTTTQMSALPSVLSTSSQVNSTKTAAQQKSQFLQLLVAQLKGQNPLDPKDGTEFISQLAQFSSLEELINIRTTLDTFFTAPTTPVSNPFGGA